MIKYFILFVFVLQANAQVADFDHISFEKADAIALEYKDESLSNLPDLVQKLTASLDTDVEKFRAIFSWVCNSVANDYYLYAKNMRKRRQFKNDSVRLLEWNEKFKKNIFRKLIKRKRTICTGYAYLVKKLANMTGIECEIVHGFARISTTDTDQMDTPDHSWNAVKINGKWYLCDPTWASGIPNPESALFEFQYNDGFFLSDPKIFSKNHFPIEDKWFLMSEPPTFEAFKDFPVIYNSAYQFITAHHTPSTLYNEISVSERLTMKATLKEKVEKEHIHFILETSFSSKKVTPTFISIRENTLEIEHQFKSSGFYDVHVYIKGELIATYVYEVSK